MELKPAIYLKKNVIAEGGSGLIFLVEYENIIENNKKYIVKIISDDGDIKTEMQTYLKIMNTKGILKTMIPIINIIPISIIKNYSSVMKYYPANRYTYSQALLMEYFDKSLDVGLCKNADVTTIKNIYSCIPLFSWNALYPQIIELVRSIASLNDHNFFHNDLKLENILISNNGNLHIIDFGLTFRMRNNGILKYAHGIFPDELIYNYSIFTLRGGKYRYTTDYSIFIKKYIACLQKVNFDIIYTKIFGIKEYADYITSMSTLTFNNDNITAKYKKNIDSFGLGLVLLYLYSFAGYKSRSCISIDNKNKCFINILEESTYLGIIRSLLCQDVINQISPKQAYFLLTGNNNAK